MTAPVLAFTVYGEAQPAGSKNASLVRRKDGSVVTTADGRPVINVRDDNPESQKWKQAVRKVAGDLMMGRELLTGPVRLDITFYRPRLKGHFGTGKNEGVLKPNAPTYPTTKPDRTKLLRGAEDALKGIVWRDDSQVCAGEAVKLYGEPARIEVTISVLEEPVRAARPVAAVTGSLFEQGAR